MIIFWLTSKQAILSHTWGNEEVLFSDVKDGDYIKSTMARAKSGYSKISHACQKTKELGSDYCWIDTLLIDEDSNAELSEATNSMFALYHASAVWIAFLEDVDGLSLGTEEPHPKWFTRGWTIAPCKVNDYNKDWTKIGVKDTRCDRVTNFMEDLRTITNIDELVLWKPAYMRNKSVAARISWAKNRQNT